VRCVVLMRRAHVTVGMFVKFEVGDWKWSWT
jgi:hypothetical protein